MGALLDKHEFEWLITSLKVIKGQHYEKIPAVELLGFSAV